MPVLQAAISAIKLGAEVAKLVSDGKIDIKLGGKSKKVIEKAFWIKSTGQLIVKDKADGEHYQIADLGNNVSAANTDAWVKAFNKIENYVESRTEQLLQEKKNQDVNIQDFIDKASGAVKTVTNAFETVKDTWGSVKDVFDGSAGGGGNAAAGGGGSGAGSSTEWYKNPLVWVAGGLILLFLFGKKLKTLFR